MHTTSCLGRLGARLAAFTALIAATASCGIEKQSAPGLAGPSEFGLSIAITANPDTIMQDGESQSLIRIVARGPDGQPVPGVMLQMSATSSNGFLRSFNFSETAVVTNATGVASVVLTAPPPPATVPTSPPIIFVNATPVGDNFVNAAPRPVEVRLLAPPGTPLSNFDPTAVILADPRVANINETIKFDASLTTDEGQACGSRCTYIWEFGDNTVAVKGMTAEHSYPLPGTYTVTLTVTDDRGGLGTATVSIRIIGPTPPIANFTVIPGSPPVNTVATFNASSSTVGVGATITQYAWDFGDGSSTVVTSSTSTTKTYTAAGSYLVTLTVTDSLGRTATRSSTVTVTP